MKLLKIENYGEYNPYCKELKSPSKSFFKKMSVSLTRQIRDLIESPELKDAFTDVVELTFAKDYKLRNYDISSHPFELPMMIEQKTAPFILLSFTVVWSVVSDVGGKGIYPWDDVSDIDIDFKVHISKDDVDKLNFLLPHIYTPIIRSADSGLPYDYQIKNQTTAGVLVFYLNSFTDQAIDELRSVLYNFFNRYNSENKSKIHYLGDFRKTKGGNASVVIDFGSCPAKAVEACMRSFKNLCFIKKIVYR